MTTMPTMSWDKRLRTFLPHLPAERELSDKTVVHIQHILNVGAAMANLAPAVCRDDGADATIDIRAFICQATDRWQWHVHSIRSCP